MNLVKNEKLENNSHELQFSIDAEAFNAAIAKAFKREAGKYNIPGFRKGKAPRHMIEKMFGADVFHYDAINDLFPEAYEAAVAESGWTAPRWTSFPPAPKTASCSRLSSLSSPR